jgi:hypothetical protein
VTAPARRLRRPLATVVWLLAVGAPVAIAILVLVSPAPEQDAWAIPLYSAIVASWGLTGAFLVTQRPDNRVGRVIWAAGVGMGLALVGQLWAYLSIAVHGGSLPGTLIGSIVGLLFGPSLYLVMLVPLLFPDGRYTSRRWAAVGALLLLSAAATLVGSLVRPGPLEGMPNVGNPLGVPALGGLPQTLVDAGGIGALLCIVAGIVAAIVRYRRGTPVERKQLTWFGSVSVLGFSMFFAAAVLPQPYGQVAWIAASLSMGLIPIAIGMAIFRYRLYEIDRIVSRTLSYALVTALLAAMFVGTNLALQAVLVNATGGSTFTVAASTLVVAALFQPVRRRIQAPIDRRFNRAGSDARRVVESLSATVRDEVDLDRLQGSVIATANEAVRPAGAGLWLRRSA